MSISSYLKETRAELKHVTWPSRGQAIRFTIAVIVLSAVTAYLLGFFDYLFAQVLERLITR